MAPHGGMMARGIASSATENMMIIEEKMETTTLFRA